MKDFFYFDTAHAIGVHDEIIKNSGGTMGILNVGLLDSTLGHIKNEVILSYY